MKSSNPISSAPINTPTNQMYPTQSHQTTLFINTHNHLCYLSIYQYKQSQHKLNLIPSHKNGQPIIFHTKLINDLRPTIFRDFEANPQTKGFKITDHFGVLTFIKRFKTLSQSGSLQDNSLDRIIETISKDLKQISKLVNNILFAMSSKLYHNPKISTLKQSRQNSIQASRNKHTLSQLHELELTIRKKINGQKEKKQIRTEIIRQPSKDNSLNYIINLKDIEIDDKKYPKKIMGGVSIAQKVAISPRSPHTLSDSLPSTLLRKSNKASGLQKYPEKSLLYQNLSYRFCRQLLIVNYLKSQGPKHYLLNYYHNQQQEKQSPVKVYYLDYAEMNLFEFLLLHHKQLGYRQLLDICLSIVKMVIDLHDSGVVHRDLKPDNILVAKQKDSYALKLIDFSDSFIVSKQAKISDEQAIHGTLPYSPLETEKSNKNYADLGLNKKQIDYWSVGMLLYTVIFRQNPVSFSSPFIRQIKTLWENEFLYPLQKKQHHINFMDQQLKLLVWHLLQVNQSKRLNLEKAREILRYLKEYNEKLLLLKFNF